MSDKEIHDHEGTISQGHTIATDTWIKARFRRTDATTIAFSVNGGAEANLTTNIPTVAVNPVFQFTNGTAVVRTHEIDFWSMKITGLSR